jgi:hypothetical protein
MVRENASVQLRDWALLLACNLIWASQFVLAKQARERMGYLSPTT